MNAGATAVVVLNWNGWQDTIGCVESLLRMTSERPLAILVCDNASTDDSIAKIRAWAQARFSDKPERWADLSRSPMPVTAPALAGKVALIQNGRNGGFAAGNNVGLRLALADFFEYFWILNNDTEVDPKALDAHVARMEQDAAIGICGAKLVYADGRNRVQAWGGARFEPLKARGVPLGALADINEDSDVRTVEESMRYVIGASMFVRRRFLETVGLMTEDYFLYFEEVDWAFRAGGRFRLGYAPGAIVYHKVGGSIGTRDRGGNSAIAEYYLARSRIKFSMRHSRISLPFVFFDTTRSIVNCMRVSDWHGASTLVRALFGLPFVSAKAS